MGGGQMANNQQVTGILRACKKSRCATHGNMSAGYCHHIRCKDNTLFLIVQTFPKKKLSKVDKIFRNDGQIQFQKF